MRRGGELLNLGSVSYSQLMREAYPGAVYYYTARPYRVAQIRLDAKAISVRREKAFHTKPARIPTLVYPNLQPGAIYSGAQHGDLDVIESDVQIREALTGYSERRGPNELHTTYPTDSQQTGILWPQSYFSRTFFTSAVTITHPTLDGDAATAQSVANYLYEAFLMAVPVERRDIGVAIDRHRSSRGPVREGARFIALYDQTYGSLRVSGKVLEDALLPDVLAAALALCKEDPEANCSGAACDVLHELARAVEKPAGPQWWSDAPQVSIGEGLRVIMPGSVGLQTLHGNREFYVEGVFLHPTGLRYRGHHEETRHNVYELIPVDQLAALQGESRMGTYNLETGELRADADDDDLEQAA
jgi:DEAD/DEAH box helicase domain-containing protein